MPVTPLRDSDPSQVGPHRLLGRLGQGGMGTVYLAVAPDQRAVAVKVLRDGLTDPDARRRFRHELDALRLVSGPHLVEVLDADVDADLPYLVTRFVPGKRLDDLVHHAGPLDLTHLRMAARGIAEALASLHGAGVVHRDLTPGNVLMLDGEPHVIDLGLAIAADVTALTRSGLVIGTPGYLAPEQVTGSLITPAVDIHAWGATIAFAATGRAPFGAGRPEAVLYRIVHGEPDLAGVPPELAELVTAAMDPDPLRRPLAPALLATLGGATHAVPVTVRLPRDADVTTVLATGLLQGASRRMLPHPTRELTAVLAGAPAAASPPGTALLPVTAERFDPRPAPSPHADMGHAPALAPTSPPVAPAPPVTAAPAPVWSTPDVAGSDGPGSDVARSDRPGSDVAGSDGPGSDGPDPDAWPEDPDRGILAALPAKTHPARAVQVGATGAAALAVTTAITLVAPVLGVAAVLLLLVSLRTVSRSSTRLRDRRERRGDRRRDPVVATLGAPWHFVLAVADTLTSLPLMLLVAAGPAAAVWFADPVASGLERTELTVATATVLGLLVALSRRVHAGSRLLLRRTLLTMTPGSSSGVAVLLALAVIAVLLLATAEGRAPIFWPAA